MNNKFIRNTYLNVIFNDVALLPLNIVCDDLR